MKDNVKRQLERFAAVDPDEKTWVHPWESYWRMFRWKGLAKRHIGLLVKIFNARFTGYSFHHGETVICNNIYPTIIVYKKKKHGKDD